MNSPWPTCKFLFGVCHVTDDQRSCWLCKESGRIWVGMRQTQRHACRSMERVHAVFLDTRHIRHLKMFHAFKVADQHRCDAAFFPSLLLLSFFLIRPPCVEPRDPAMMTTFPKGCLSSAAESFRKPTGGERAREGQDTQTSHSLVP